MYEYDDHQRVTAEIWYATATDADVAANPVNTIHFAYDDAGRITSEWDDLSSVSYVYTDSGLLAATTQAHLGGPTVVLAYGYNDAGLRTSTAATIDGVADYVDEYAYDSAGRLVAIAQYGAAGGNAVAAKEISLGYNDQGLLATVARYTDGNLAVLAQYSYDSAGRLTGLVYSQGDTILASYAWTYSDDGASLLPSSFSLPTSLSWLPSGGIMPGQDTTAIVDALWEGTGTPASLITEITSLDGTVSYSYDSAGQLLAATYTTDQTSEAYSYDAAGNRLTANGAAYLTGPNNQLLFDGVFSYSYDPEGNRTARYIDSNANGLLDAGDTAATTYAWDHRNRLTRVTDYDVYGDPAIRAVDYLYDIENRWIGRDVDLGGNGQIDSRTRFAYDGNQIILQFDRALAPSDDPTDPLTIDHLSHRYLWNPAAVDQLMADEHVTTPDTPGSILWPLADHLGTIRDLAAYDSATDATTIVNHRTFDAYGNLQSQSNPAHDTLFAFTGRPLDQETSLQNNLHRWYDATIGRWMSEDPIGFEGRDGNLYTYLGNGPVNAVDSNGLQDPSGYVRFAEEQAARVAAEKKRMRRMAEDVMASLVRQHESPPTIYGSVTGISDALTRLAKVLETTTVLEFPEGGETDGRSGRNYIRLGLGDGPSGARTYLKPSNLVHELVHVLDKQEGFSWGGYYTWVNSKEEGLAYGFEELLRATRWFQIIEEHILTNEPLETIAKKWRQAWQQIGMLIGPLSSPEGVVYYPDWYSRQFVVRHLEVRDLERVAEHLGVQFVASELADAYVSAMLAAGYTDEAAIRAALAIPKDLPNIFKNRREN